MLHSLANSSHRIHVILFFFQLAHTVVYWLFNGITGKVTFGTTAGTKVIAETIATGSAWLYLPFGILFVLVGVMAVISNLAAGWRKKPYSTNLLTSAVLLAVQLVALVIMFNVIFPPLVLTA